MRFLHKVQPDFCKAKILNYLLYAFGQFLKRCGTALFLLIIIIISIITQVILARKLHFWCFLDSQNSRYFGGPKKLKMRFYKQV